jgi:putative membrane protein
MPEMPASETQKRFAFVALIVLHSVGLVGLNVERFQADFLSLVWINLLFVFSIVMSLHTRWNLNYAYFVGGVFGWGMLTEIVGVKTGMLFGAYHYTPLLGQQIGGVPIIIGLNWVVVTYCAGDIAKRIDPSPMLRVAFGALLMVLLDWLIEPFAIRYGLWVWDAGHPPLHNYIGWFAVGAVAQYLYHRWASEASNPVAGAAFVILALFFTLDRLANILF